MDIKMVPAPQKDAVAEHLLSSLQSYRTSVLSLSAVGCLFTLISLYLLVFGSEILRFDPSTSADALLLFKWIVMSLCVVLLGVPFIKPLRNTNASREEVSHAVSWTVVNIAAFFFLAFFSVHPSTFPSRPACASDSPMDANRSVNSTFSHRNPPECSTFTLIDLLRICVMFLSIALGMQLMLLPAATSRLVGADYKVKATSGLTAGRLFTVVYVLCVILMVADLVREGLRVADLLFAGELKISRDTPKIVTDSLVFRGFELVHWFVTKTAPRMAHTVALFFLVIAARSGITNWKTGSQLNAGVSLYIATWASTAIHNRISQLCFNHNQGHRNGSCLPYRTSDITILDIVLVLACLGAVMTRKNIFVDQPSSANRGLKQKDTVIKIWWEL